MITKDLIGEWKLENFEIKKPNGDKKLWGVKMHGILLYTPNGYMSVSINKEVKCNATSEQTLKSLLFYAGTYEMIDGKILHHVMNATDFSRIGKKLVREAKIEKGKLMLIGHGNFGTAFLTWHKIGKHMNQ